MNNRFHHVYARLVANEAHGIERAEPDDVELCGFIRPSDNSRDVFFHVTSLVDLEFDAALEEREVEFDIQHGDKGPRAVRVRPAR